MTIDRVIFKCEDCKAKVYRKPADRIVTHCLRHDCNSANVKRINPRGFERKA